jgi:hypothetical protein
MMKMPLGMNAKHFSCKTTPPRARKFSRPTVDGIENEVARSERADIGHRGRLSAQHQKLKRMDYFKPEGPDESVDSSDSQPDREEVTFRMNRTHKRAEDIYIIKERGNSCDEDS